MTNDKAQNPNQGGNGKLQSSKPKRPNGFQFDIWVCLGLRGVTQEATAMNKVKLESEVIDFIQRHRLISPGEMVVVGVSGGADSVCLLHVLAKW
jgi:hypothetical protein